MMRLASTTAIQRAKQIAEFAYQRSWRDRGFRQQHVRADDAGHPRLNAASARPHGSYRELRVILFGPDPTGRVI